MIRSRRGKGARAEPGSGGKESYKNNQFQWHKSPPLWVPRVRTSPPGLPGLMKNMLPLVSSLLLLLVHFCHIQAAYVYIQRSPPPPRSACCILCSSTRSTATEEEERFAVGATARASRLAGELESRGFGELDELLTDPAFRGSAALRTYNSFVYPKSEGAWANAEKPQRAATIAQQICFFVREQRASTAEWLRNHDRALTSAASLPTHPLHLVLDNVRSAANVGNILRAAEAARVVQVFHCGITPVPPDPKVLKTAMGAADYVRHEHSGSTLAVVRELQAAGIAVWACETSSRSADLQNASLPQPLALVLGNELIGVDTHVLEAVDGIVEIPCFGVKNSLNVATAASVVMWEALRQWASHERHPPWGT